jgi:hypothetical protein
MLLLPKEEPFLAIFSRRTGLWTLATAESGVPKGAVNLR